MGKYRTIVADPPWNYDSPGRFTAHPSPLAEASSAARYGSMTTGKLTELRPPAAPDAHLYLWTTNAFMVEAHEIAEAWGFGQKTILTWTKTHQGDPSRVSMKMGHYFRGATEHCLFCVRGSLKINEGVTLPTGYLWPRLPHSVKPDAFYDLVEQASPGPYLELFARRARFGWDYWGDQSLGTAQLGGDGELDSHRPAKAEAAPGRPAGSSPAPSAEVAA